MFGILETFYDQNFFIFFDLMYLKKKLKNQKHIFEFVVISFYVEDGLILPNFYTIWSYRAFLNIGIFIDYQEFIFNIIIFSNC